eukprot:CAMPEP_0170314614 /NCGR_PEP_ID=MMETSP0116_2-20130129/57886_1 /TAXON_ID=400756 /ORGANISM="Durinskia baltica, Strain CSIRO CS-38" /LENGTH=50 /DNA_ID=CAMNT_0010567075 /DNA_START=1 /DNA_END=150 /DNA_ORIENTATION=+
MQMSSVHDAPDIVFKTAHDPPAMVFKSKKDAEAHGVEVRQRQMQLRLSAL